MVMEILFDETQRGDSEHDIFLYSFPVGSL